MTMHRSGAGWAAAAAAAALLLGGCQAAQSAETGGAAAIPRGELRALEGRIVFVSEHDGQADVYSIRPDGRDVRRLTDSNANDYPAAATPDGRTLLVVSSRGEGQEQRERMMVTALRGGAGRQVGPLAMHARSPAWSPDGSWLAFESDSASFRDLYRVQASGAGLMRLTDDPEGNFDPHVSPDGRWIAFVSSRDGDAEVYVMRADGGEPRRLTAFHRDDWAPRWSPDGRTILFLSNRESVDRVYLVAPDGTGLRALGAAGADTALSEADPVWSPDGSRVALTLRRRGGGARVVVVGAAGGPVTPVSGADEAASTPAWSPDGRHLVYAAERGGETQLRVARADGTGTSTVAGTPGADWLPRWVP